MSLLGYDPNQYFTGRAPIEAAAQGIVLGPDDWAIRCNLVTVQNQVMVDFTADHISNAEAIQLLRTAQERLGNECLEFCPGVSYRNLLIYRGKPGVPSPFTIDSRTSAPHDLTDGTVIDDLSHSAAAEIFNQCAYCVSYDPYTMLSSYAAVCGCVSVVVPQDGIPKEMWQPSDSEFANGVAYGFDDVDSALRTRPKLLQYFAQQEVNNGREVRTFVDLVRSHFSPPSP